ncbi:MAG: M12 family metallopeptidase [Acidobacteriota bacterium]
MKTRPSTWTRLWARVYASLLVAAVTGPALAHGIPKEPRGTLEKPADGSRAAETGVTYISGPHFIDRKVVYEKVDGLAIFEGDIILGSIEEAEAWNEAHDRGEAATQKSILRSPGFFWPNGAIPFAFEFTVPADRRADFRDAARHWYDSTGIELIESPSSPDLVLVRQVSLGCRSAVGRTRGFQFIDVDPTCSVGEMIHLIGHTIGFWHEHTREDRDQFIRVNWGNIQPNQDHNFTQHIADGTDLGEYDYGSIMHVARDYFSRNGLPTLQPIDENGNPIPTSQVQIGQRQGLSPSDIQNATRIYFPPIRFYEGNNGSGSEVCRLDPVSQTVNFQQDGLSCENDEARSVDLRLLPADVSLVLYDDPNCSTNDDWTVIRTKNPVTSFLVGSFESNLTTEDVKVTHHHKNGLDGKVSCAQVTVCGDDICEGLESCYTCPSDCGECPSGGPIGPGGGPCDSLSCAMSCGGPASGTCTAGQCQCF